MPDRTSQPNTVWAGLSSVWYPGYKFATLCALIKGNFVLNVSLRRNTVADCVCDLATDLQQHLMGKRKDFIAYSLAVDESSDTSDTAQLSIFIRGVDSTVRYR